MSIVQDVEDFFRIFFNVALVLLFLLFLLALFLLVLRLFAVIFLMALLVYVLVRLNRRPRFGGLEQ